MEIAKGKEEKALMNEAEGSRREKKNKKTGKMAEREGATTENYEKHGNDCEEDMGE